MSGPANRRGFLRDLVGLPLIGGGLTLIGAPVAVAAPCSPALLREYANWIAFEHYRAQTEAFGTMHRPWYDHRGEAYEWHARERLEPSTRAALVLSAVGCGWEART